MVNYPFKDTYRADSDPDANTACLLEIISQYRDCSVCVTTVYLQGAISGCESAVNSACNRAGSLRVDYVVRIGRVVDVCDAQSITAILGYNGVMR